MTKPEIEERIEYLKSIFTDSRLGTMLKIQICLEVQCLEDRLQKLDGDADGRN